MKVFSVILAIAPALCGALETSNESSTKGAKVNYWTQTKPKADQNVDDEERKLYYRGSHANQGTWSSSQMKYGRWGEPSSKKSSKSTYGTSAKMGKKGSSKYEKEEEGGDEVFIQVFGCPGKCLDIQDIPNTDLVSVVHNPCNNCNKDQKWRINTYKGSTVQVEHVASGMCMCIAESTNSAVDGSDVCADYVVKLGPCHHYGKASELSLFTYTGGQFFSNYCRDVEGTNTLLTVFSNAADDSCSPPVDSEPFLFTIETTPEEPIFSESILMTTDCLLNPNMCQDEWW